MTANAVAGRGLFLACLDRALRSRGLAVAYREHGLDDGLTEAGAVAP